MMIFMYQVVDNEEFFCTQPSIFTQLLTGDRHRLVGRGQAGPSHFT